MHPQFRTHSAIEIITDAAKVACSGGIVETMFGGETQRDRILLVDDEPGILITTQAILEADGYEVETANSGQAALQMLENTNYDLLVLDLRMEDMDGLELLEQTQHFFPQPLAI